MSADNTHSSNAPITDVGDATGQSILPWQATQWQQVHRQLSADRLPHGLLLAGPAGIGKLNFALCLANYLLCLSPVDDIACGRCKSCQLLLAGTHPDLLLVRPEDGSSALKVDQIRKLTNTLSKTAQQGGNQLAVIEPAEALNVNAANALLKCLEEPGANTFLILVTHQVGLVLPTLKSRCQLMAFPLPSEETSAPWLQPLAGTHDAKQLLQRASGAPLRAKELMREDLLEQHLLVDTTLTALAMSRSTLSAAALTLSKLPEQLLLERLIQCVQWLLRTKYSNTTPEIEELAELSGLRELDARVLCRFHDKMVAQKRFFLSTANLNKQLFTEELLLDWQALNKLSNSKQQLSGQKLLNGLL